MPSVPFPAFATRRNCLLALALACTGAIAHAAPPTVEIVAYAHPPVQSALEPLRDWLVAQGGKVNITEVDLDTPAGERRLQAVGIKGHVPVVVLVDGQFRHRRADGTTVELVGFPRGASTPHGAGGAWSIDDVKSVVSRAGKSGS